MAYKDLERLAAYQKRYYHEVVKPRRAERKPEIQAWHKRWRKANQEQFRARRRRDYLKMTPDQRYHSHVLRTMRRYKITKEHALTLLEQTTCALCLVTRSPSKRLSIDHEHGTGRIRGAICQKCNSGLGNFKDSPALLGRAIEYLQAERA